MPTSSFALGVLGQLAHQVKLRLRRKPENIIKIDISLVKKESLKTTQTVFYRTRWKLSFFDFFILDRIRIFLAVFGIA